MVETSSKVVKDLETTIANLEEDTKRRRAEAKLTRKQREDYFATQKRKKR